MSESKLTERDLSMLRHMLGINTPWDDRPKPYRNYAAVEPENDQFKRLSGEGYVVSCGFTAFSSYEYFKCTDKGTDAAIQSHRSIRWPRAKRRYHRYLDICDCFPDHTFGDFIKDPELRKHLDVAG